MMTRVKPIRVIVVDDHDLLRDGVSACLNRASDIEVVGGARTGEEGITLTDELCPDVVIVDIVMPGLGGIATISALREARDDLGLLALSSFYDSAKVRDALTAGANGYLIKAVDNESLVHAVRTAAAGQSVLSPEAAAALTVEPRRRNALDELTDRERQIVVLVAEGRTNNEIADELCLSVFTVKNHVSSVLMKLGVQTRTEAAAVVHRAETLPN